MNSQGLLYYIIIHINIVLIKSIVSIQVPIVATAGNDKGVVMSNKEDLLSNYAVLTYNFHFTIQLNLTVWFCKWHVVANRST